MLLSLENATARKRVGDFAAIDMFVEAGFTGMDYSFFNEPKDWEKCFGTPDVFRKMEKIRRYAEEKGLVLCQSHAPFRFREGMEMNESEPEFCRIVRSMELAAAMGIPAIVVHSVMLQEEPGLPGYNERLLDYNERYYNALLPYAERFGIRIAVENTDGFRGYEQKAIEFLLESPKFGLTWDIGHSKAGREKDVPFILARRDRLIHFHIHDGTEIPPRNHLALGDGEIDLKDRLALAVQRNARCVLETKTIEALKRSVGWLRENGPKDDE